MDGINFCKTASSLRRALVAHPLFNDPGRGLMLRVAARWLKASQEAEYDLLLRLQVLEGAAQVHVGIWFGKGGRNGLRLARAYFAENPQPEMKPEWLDPRYSRMFGIVEGRLEAAIRSYGVTKVGPLDIINNYLMGLPIDPEGEQTQGSKRVCYATGAFLADKIFSGKETPESTAKGLLSQFFIRKVSNEAKQMRLQRQLPVSDEGVPLDIEDKQDEEGVWNLLGAITFRDLNHPLGKKLRQLMRQTWQRMNSISGEAMVAWLDALEEGTDISKDELAQMFGGSPQNFSAHWWPLAWRKFYEALWQHKGLLKDLQSLAAAKGYQWTPEAPGLESNPDLARLKRKHGSQEPLDQLLQNWSRCPR
jgi:hypothetical protein